MLFVKTPVLVMRLFPELIWHFSSREKEQEDHIYLTFDDGPTPEVTPWVLDCLKQYSDSDADLTGKRVLELGPGADLGVGLILLAMGAEKYTARDVHNLAASASGEFYDRLFENLADRADIDSLRHQLDLTRDGSPEKLCYQCDPKFDLSVLPDESVDLGEAVAH